MSIYTHAVQYYETDKMGITHHSNYVRWMEEARCHFLSEIGWDYAKLESLGIISPVTLVEGKYIKTTTYPDMVYVEVSIEEFKGVRLKVKYVMKNGSDEVVFEGRSEHCFLDPSGKPVRIKKDYPEFYETIVACINVE